VVSSGKLHRPFSMVTMKGGIRSGTRSAFAFLGRSGVEGRRNSALLARGALGAEHEPSQLPSKGRRPPRIQCIGRLMLGPSTSASAPKKHMRSQDRDSATGRKAPLRLAWIGTRVSRSP